MASQEIRDFMLGTKASRKSTVPSTPPPPTRTSTAAAVGSASLSSPHQGTPPTLTTPQTNKHRSGIVKALIQSITNWLDHDTTAYQLVQSVTNLRDRIWYTSQMLVGVTAQSASQRRSSFGSSRSSSRLNKDDLDMTLDHGIQQHEKMLVQLRRTMAALGTSHEAVGRRLDELYRHDLVFGMMDSTSTKQNRGGTTSSLHGAGILSLLIDQWSDLYTALSTELYRKQRLTEQVLHSSVAKGLLVLVPERFEEHSTTTREDATNHSPRHVAHQCYMVWPRAHKESYLCGHGNLLNEIESQAP